MEIKGLILNHISNFIFKQNKIHTEYLFYLKKKKNLKKILSSSWTRDFCFLCIFFTIAVLTSELNFYYEVEQKKILNVRGKILSACEVHQSTY